MNNTRTLLYKILWAGMFIVCAVLGFVSQPDTASSIIMKILGLLFFLPPALLLAESWKTRCVSELKRLRLVAILSLSVSFVLMIANFLSVLGPEWLGDVLYWTLAVVGTPMACLQGPVVSLLAWAVLLFAAMEGLKEAKK